MLVSIIIPYYNRPQKLERALQSIYVQSYQNFEIIVVDDYSTIPPIATSLQNVKYIKNKENKGPGYSRNQGLKITKGNFICFLDSDDYWHKDFLDTMVKTISKKKDAVMAYSNGYNVDENGIAQNIRRDRIIRIHSILPYIVTHGRPWGTGACIWRVSLIKNIEWISSRNWEDYAFDISVSIQNNIIIPVSKPLVFYDTSGKDKLSHQKKENVLFQKNYSISYISETLSKSKYLNNQKIVNAMVVIVLNNMIALMKNDVKNNKMFKNNLKNLSFIKKSLLSRLISIILFLPNTFKLPIIRHLRYIYK